MQYINVYNGLYLNFQKMDVENRKLLYCNKIVIKFLMKEEKSFFDPQFMDDGEGSCHFWIFDDKLDTSEKKIQFDF